MSQALTLEQVVDALRARGVIAADAPPADADEASRPWFVSLMLGVAGWLAGVFIMSFIGIVVRPSSAFGFLGLGLALAGGAWALYNADREGAFFDQLALALSIAGQVSIAWGLLEDVRSGALIAVVLLVLQLGVLAAMPNRTARILAALSAAIAWVFTVRFLIRPGPGDEMFFGGDAHLSGMGIWSVPVVWLLTWIPLVLLVVRLIEREGAWMAGSLRDYARAALTGVLLAIALGGAATEPFVVLALGVDSVGQRFSFWMLFPLLSIALAMFAAWCAHRLRSPGLMGFAIFAALLHLGRFYYLYGSSLLSKAVIMLCTGVLLLVIGALLSRRAAAAQGAP